MSPPEDSLTLLSDAEWLPTHWDRSGKVRFVRLAREQHGQVTFLSDEYLGPLNLPASSAVLSDLHPPAGGPASQYIFHSAFAASTLLARALDVPGISMGLKEPEILNELAEGMRARALSEEALRTVVQLLARPFASGEKVVIKPSNVVNVLAPSLLELDPGSNAIFLFAPLPRFLRSIADKGLWGRCWVRRLHALVARDTGLDFGLSAAERFELTDLQVAALAWLMQHKQGGELVARFHGRVRTLDSETFLAERPGTIAAVANHFGLAIDEARAGEIAAGPAFATHSKEIGRAFDPEAALQPKTPLPIIDEEIAMVAQWTHSVADHAGIAIEFPPESRLLP